MTRPNQQKYIQFSWQLPFADSQPDAPIVQALFDHVAQWAIDNAASYVLQPNSTQWDIVRAPATGGPYGEIIWYAQAV